MLLLPFAAVPSLADTGLNPSQGKPPEAAVPAVQAAVSLPAPAAQTPIAASGCGNAPPGAPESQGLLQTIFGSQQPTLSEDDAAALRRGFLIFPTVSDAETTSAKFSKLRDSRNKLVPLIASCTAKYQRDQSASTSSVSISKIAAGSNEEREFEQRIEHDNQVRLANVEQDRKDLDYLQHLLERIDEAASEALIPESDQNRFKTTLSYVYAGVVGVVIAGFYAIALVDSVVRRAIFSGEAGIQFVTLFSLVIAIILFGIIGVLEAKELSALLGGIAGYILGRTTTGLKPVEHAEAAPAKGGGSPPPHTAPPHTTSDATA